jgi:hypothetical protein
VDFYSSDQTTAAKDAKYKQKEKFPAKTLVWLAVSPRGKLKEVDANTVQRLMEGVLRKLRKAKDHGARTVL